MTVSVTFVIHAPFLKHSPISTLPQGVESQDMSAGPAYDNLTIVRAEKSIYIKRYVCVFVCVSRFVCPPGDKHFFHTGEGEGTNIFHTQE